MSLEFNPVGMACNIACEYCYEKPMRDSGNVTSKLDLDKALAALDKHNQPFSLFGGEPLLLKIHFLEEIFKHGLKKWNQNGIQTNGTLITSPHLELFKRYKVHIGFSIDGPWPINFVRCSEILTNLSISNLHRCLEEGISSSLIFTVHKDSIFYQDELVNWLTDLDERGLKSARIHLLERDNNVEAADENQLIAFLLRLEELELGFKNLKFDLFSEIFTLLQNPLNPNVTCVWNKCDPYTTAAVQGVGPSGEQYNCGRTNKDGIQWAKASRAGAERQTALYYTDCMDCKYFLACKGYCPGTAIDGDWRRKTEYCNVLKTLFKNAEERLIHARIPVFTNDPNRKEAELRFLSNINSPSGKGCNQQHQDWHIDGHLRTGNVPVIR